MLKKNLTHKQGRFARLVAAGSTFADAYREAYDCKTDKLESVYQMASRVMGNVKVTSRVDELRQSAAESEGITVESSLQELDRLKRKAAEGKNFGAAVRTEELRGKLAGLYVEKHEDIGQQMSDEELASSIADAGTAAYEVVLGLTKGEPMGAARVASIAAKYMAGPKAVNDG